MKFAICNEMFQNWSIENQFEAFAAWGYDGAELAPFSLDPEFVNGNSKTMSLDRITPSVRKRLLLAANKNNIIISGLHWVLANTIGFHITTGDSNTRIFTSQYLSQLVLFCSELGGSYIVLGSPNQRNIAPNQTRAEATENALDTISRVLPTLEKTGVVLALEALAPTETNFWVNADEVISFIKRLGNPEFVTLHLDCKAMHGGEYQSIPDTIRYAYNKKRYVTFHANDPNLQGPGFGRLDFKPIISALKEVKFDGWIGIEPFDYTPGIVKLARESIRYLHNSL